ncbi:MAG TPA: cytochrome c [Terriglobales bacterium]|jgi:cytochrome c oxidase cbb3-type subunit 3|nr:cytochrome c [Terriglobales bacterium]
MKHGVSLVTLAIVALLACAACSRAPGIHRADSEVVPPSEVIDFNVLYGQNCAGCHGIEGKGGAAMALANPVYLTIADSSVIRRIASDGVTGTPMPAFAESAGGMLTDKQIDSLVRGIRSWAKADSFGNQTPPPYAAQIPGKPQRGADAYRTYCSSCHGVDGHGGDKGSSIVNGSYLALVSDQQLRTIVIAGRPELGAPDWRGDVEGRPMSAQDISDVVAWLSSQRPKFPGQPYPIASMNSANGGSR